MPNKELDLFKELIPAIDGGMKELYDAATDVGKKDIKGDLWNLNRYISSVKGSRDKQELAVFKTNEYYNKNWNVLGGTDHVKLQWQLLCVAGNTGKNEFHPWIALRRKKDASSKGAKLISEIYPNMKMDEVELLARTLTKKELKQLAEEHNIDIKF
jgi:hypothetical protein|tara:strand:- start:3962 stop:4429 length:468 start_codon:yes stop_codon:yes gene_type:complete